MTRSCMEAGSQSLEAELVWVHNFNVTPALALLLLCSGSALAFHLLRTLLYIHLPFSCFLCIVALLTTLNLSQICCFEYNFRTLDSMMRISFNSRLWEVTEIWYWILSLNIFWSEKVACLFEDLNKTEAYMKLICRKKTRCSVWCLTSFPRRRG